MKKILLLSVFAALSTIAYAGEHDMASHKRGSKEFERIKALAGDWKGSYDMDGKKEVATTSFRLSAAGSAVVETMAAGTPYEMTNVYHDVEGKLMMTHYCAMGNAPQLQVAKSDSESISFVSIKANGIDPKTTPHMGGLVYVQTDKDHFTATWTSANMKEHEGPSTFSYARVAGR